MEEFKLSVNKPCSENWNAFTPSEKGRFCQSCQKNVVDFTMMSEREIKAFFNKKPTQVCGRFHTTQLTSYSSELQLKPKNKNHWLKACFLSLLLVGSGKGLMAQKQPPKTQIEKTIGNNLQNQVRNKTDEEITVEGVVISKEDKEPLPGVAVLIKGTAKGTFADIDGKFKLENLKEGDVLVFSYIGFMQREVKVAAKNTTRFVMNMDLELVCDIMGEVAVEGLYTRKKQSGIGKLLTGITQVFK